jgi:hypothetical protein
VRDGIELTKILVGLALTAALIAATVLGYRYFDRNYTVSKDASGRAQAQVVAATLYGRNDLRVSRLSGTVQGVGQTSRLWGWLTASQVVKAPFTVDYFVPLGRLRLQDFRYDADREVMFVDAPDVVPERANIDLANTTLNQTRGVFVTRGAMAEMSRQVSTSATQVAAERARSPENIDKSRAHARAALERLIGGSLRAAGLDARVEVRFPDERRSPEQMDRSTPLSEILAR